MERKKTLSFFRNTDSGLFIAALLLFVILSLSSNSFATAYNMFNIARTLSLYLLIALTQAIILVGGGMSLSIGAIGGLATITTGYFLDSLGMSAWIAVLIGLIVGVIAGAINGIIVSKTGLSAFVVTLATSFIYSGLIFGITKGYAFTHIPESFTFVGRGKFLGLPIIFYMVIVILIIVFIMFKFSLFGRRLLATGDNIEAARLSGINTDRIIFTSHVISGFISAVAAITYISRMSSAQPAAGQDWMIVSFAIAVIGGTALKGGTISIIGIFLGGVIMVLIKNGLILLNVNVYFEQVFFGSLILFAVSIDRIRQVYSIKI
ncbi:MAG: ABC transporter permease [Candidatus Humimicrobiaceae bacterium]